MTSPSSPISPIPMKCGSAIDASAIAGESLEVFLMRLGNEEADECRACKQARAHGRHRRSSPSRRSRPTHHHVRNACSAGARDHLHKIGLEGRRLQMAVRVDRVPARSGLPDDARVEPEDAVAAGRKSFVVRDDHDGRALVARELEEDVEDALGGRLVEVARRLVGENADGLRDDGACNGDALALAARRAARAGAAGGG